MVMASRTDFAVTASYRAHPLSMAITGCLQQGSGMRLASAAVLTLAMAVPSLSQGDTFAVTNLLDSGSGSLRRALQDANTHPGADQVTFSSVSGTLALTSGPLAITDSVAISGPGSDLLTIDGNLAAPLVQINITDADITLSGLTLTRGAAVDSRGGAITCEMAVGQAGSTLTISDAVITGNVGFGIGVKVFTSPEYSPYPNENTAQVIISDSTVSANSDGGVTFETYYNKATPTLQVTHSTISGNSGPGLDGSSYHPWMSAYYTAQIDIQDSAILDNHGIGVSGGCTAVSVNNSTISGNGGGVAAGAGTFCDMNHYGPSQTIVENSQIVGNDWGVWGGRFGYPFVINSQVSGNRGNGVYLYTGGGAIVIESSRISGNDGVGVVESSGGYADSMCSVSNSTIDNNQGGGIEVSNFTGWVHNELDISNSTISGNFGAFGGVRFYSAEQGPLRIRNSTIVGNSADAQGGGVQWGYYFENEARAMLENSIVAGNTVGGSGSDLEGIFTAAYSLIQAPGAATIHEPVAGSNLIGVDPGLGPLQDNGGPTPTHALLSGSPALDRGDPDFAPPPDFDQRGDPYARVGHGRLDIGAYEVQGAAPAAIGVWRPSDRGFRLDTNDNGRWDGVGGGDTLTAAFGQATDRPVVGDWNGDHADDVGFWRPSTRQFFLDTNGNRRWDGVAGGDTLTGAFGLATDLPVTGDWSGEGTDGVGTWRPSDRRFRLDSNGNGWWDGVTGGDTLTDAFGQTTDRPVVGDWNGDGREEVGFWRSTDRRFRLDTNGNGRWDGTAGGDTLTDAFGSAADLPVTGDWNGDGADEIGCWRPTTRQFFLDVNANKRWDGATGGDTLTSAFGASTDVPLAGAW